MKKGDFEGAFNEEQDQKCPLGENTDPFELKKDLVFTLALSQVDFSRGNPVRERVRARILDKAPTEFNRQQQRRKWMNISRVSSSIIGGVFLLVVAVIAFGWAIENLVPPAGAKRPSGGIGTLTAISPTTTVKPATLTPTGTATPVPTTASSTAAETADPIYTAPAPPTPIPSSWKTFSAPTLNIQFRYPAQWQAETPLHLSGTDGFVEVSLLDYSASLFDVIRTLCVLEANPDKPAVYGSSPLIEDWQGGAAEQQASFGRGCMVMPLDNLPADGLAQAVLFTRYPSPLMHDQLLVLRADKAHFAGILSTLRFQGYAAPAPSNGYYDSPACHAAQVGSPQVVLRTDALVITETAIANKNCDPWLQIDGFQALVNGSELRAKHNTSFQDGLWRTAANDNLALARFDFRLVEHTADSPNTFISFDLYHGEQLLLGGLTRLGQVTVNSASDDFILWVQNTFDSKPPVEVRSGQTRGLAGFDDGFNTAWVGADLIGYEYADTPRFPIGSPARVNITRNEQVVDTLAVAQFGPAGDPVTGFWSWNGHWLLEMDSVLVQDGQLMNTAMGYAEIFEWNLVNGQPFYFFHHRAPTGSAGGKNAGYGLSYSGQELPLRYDDIIHGQLCCSAALYGIVSTPSGAWFYALSNDIWYLVQVQVK